MKISNSQGMGGIGISLMFCLLAVGCGTTGITGDLPPVTGQVYRTDTDELVPQARVTLITDEGQRFVTFTDAEGRFSFPKVPANAYELLVEPPGGPQASGLEAQQIRIKDGPTFLALALPKAPAGPAPGRPERVIIQPTERIVSLEPGPQKIQFTALLVGEGVEELRPNWLVRGDIGWIDLQGVFTPTQVGTGLVIAQVDDVEAVAVVRVEQRYPFASPSSMRPERRPHR